MAADRSLIRITERDGMPENRLAVLEHVWRRFDDDTAMLKQGGLVAEVSPTHYKVNGLSDIARLGDVVEHRSRSGSRQGEIVHIGRDDVVVAPLSAAPMPASATPSSGAVR